MIDLNINIKRYKIKIIKIYLKSKLIKYFQIFLIYVNFYQYIITNFSKIGVIFIEMLKISIFNI